MQTGRATLISFFACTNISSHPYLTISGHDMCPNYNNKLVLGQPPPAPSLKGTTYGGLAVSPSP